VGQWRRLWRATAFDIRNFVHGTLSGLEGAPALEQTDGGIAEPTAGVVG
jgi:hypothetical protein